MSTKNYEGLDYYCRTVFEFTSDRLGAQSGVGGGGRYDGLVEMLGGPATPGIGWAAGVERIILASAQSGDEADSCDLLVVVPEPELLNSAFKLAADARSAGLSARLEVGGRSVKAAFKHADKIGARAVAIVEVEGLQLKDLGDGSQVGHPSPASLVEAVVAKIKA